MTIRDRGTIELPKLALLDWDKTFYMGLSAMDLLETMIAQMSVGVDQLIKLEEDIYAQEDECFKHGNITYDVFCERFGHLWGEGFNGLPVDEVNNLGELVAESSFIDGKIHSSRFEFIKIIVEAGYNPVVVSLGPYEVIAPAAAKLGITEVYAARVHSDEGVYMNNLKTNLHIVGGKEKLVNELFNSERFNISRSIGYGDSLNDVGMLKPVEFRLVNDLTNHPILRSNQNMVDYANKHVWTVVTDETLVSKTAEYLKRVA